MLPTRTTPLTLVLDVAKSRDALIDYRDVVLVEQVDSRGIEERVHDAARVMFAVRVFCEVDQLDACPPEAPAPAGLFVDDNRDRLDRCRVFGA